MNMQLLSLRGLGLFLIIRLAMLLSGCDETPAFVVEDAQLDKEQLSSELDAEALKPEDGNPFAGGSEDDPVIVKVDDETNPDDPILVIEPEVTVAKLETEHAAANYDDGETVFSIDELLLESRYEMDAERMDANENFSQITRPPMMQQWTQGTNGSERTDSFTQNMDTNGVLDVLVVIDNSGSMQQEQANLSTKLQPLLSEVAGSDWQIGVVTTDNGNLRDLIKKGDPDAETAFAAAVNAGVSGSGNEQGIRYAVAGLSQGGQPTPWLRANSTVAVLIVSDEDNCSNNGSGCGSDPWNIETYLSDHLASIRVPGVNARVYGIFWHPSENSAACPTGAYQATQYSRIVAGTNGAWGSICDADYTQTLAQISQDISVILETQFTLAFTPDPNYTTVKVDGTPVTTGFTITGNVITFDQPPMEGAKIDVTYRYGSSPILKEFQLSQPAVAQTLEVKVNNNTVDPMTYSYDSGSKTIAFNDYPQPGSNIKANFIKDVPLDTEFVIAGEAIGDTVAAKVNGNVVDPSGYTFDPAAKKVTFMNAPYDSASIAISYQVYGAPVLTYPYSMSEGQTNVEVTDLDTGDAIAYSYDGQNIAVDASDFVRGRKFKAVDPDASGVTTYDVSLPVTPIEETVVVSFEEGDCRPPGNVTINGKTVNLENCEFGTSIDDGKVSYTYLTSVKQEIALEEDFFNQPHVGQVWRVWVDGQLTSAYEVEDHVVKFSEPLNEGNKVTIQVSLIKAI